MEILTCNCYRVEGEPSTGFWMNPTNPLEPLIEQLEDILRKTEEEFKHPSDKPLSPDLLKQVAELEKNVKLYLHIHQTLMRVSKTDKQKVEQIVAHVPASVLPKDRLVLERLTQLKESIMQVKAFLAKETKKLAETEEEIKKKAVTQRRKKFRGVGGKDRWKKL